MYDAKCLGTCQCMDLCRFSVSDIASAGGIGHGPNGVTPGLTTKSVSMASLASSSALGARLLLHSHHLPTNHTLHRHMAPDYRIIKRDLMRCGRQFCSDGAATATTKQNTAIVHVHGLPDTRFWVLGDQTDPIRCETYVHHCLRSSTAWCVYGHTSNTKIQRRRQQRRSQLVTQYHRGKKKTKSIIFEFSLA